MGQVLSTYCIQVDSDILRSLQVSAICYLLSTSWKCTKVHYEGLLSATSFCRYEHALLHLELFVSTCRFD